MPRVAQQVKIDLEWHYFDRVAEFERQASAPGQVVSMGSPHQELLDANRYLPGDQIVNRAIAGDRISVPSMDDIAAGDERVVATIRNRLPQVPLLLVMGAADRQVA